MDKINKYVFVCLNIIELYILIDFKVWKMIYKVKINLWRLFFLEVMIGYYLFVGGFNFYRILVILCILYYFFILVNNILFFFGVRNFKIRIYLVGYL